MTVREGELSFESLQDAVVAELDAGRRPFMLAVGPSPLGEDRMDLLAVRILAGDGGPLDVLRVVMPRVAVDFALPVGSWALYERDEAGRENEAPAGSS